MLKNIVILIFALGCFNAFAADNEVEKIQHVIESVAKKYAPDNRTALFNVSILPEGEPLILKGETNIPEAKKVMLDSLSSYKIAFTDSITVLPDVSVGEKQWGIVTLSVANIRTQPDHAAELSSQALMGTPVKVLKITNGWRYIQTPEAYLGWVDENGIVLNNREQMLQWSKSTRYIFNSLTGNVMDAPKRNASPVSDLVLGDLFETVSVKKAYLQVVFPDGRTGYVKKKDCLSYEYWINKKPDVNEVLSIARQLLGTAYLWGGTSCKAVDCSGMIKTAWYSQGVILARDASQQIRYGEKIDFENMENLQPGDFLFFGRNAQRITHVGMYLGKGLYIHASGLVRINSIDPKDPAYNITLKKNLVGAVRIINSLGTEGLALVKNHPWYGQSIQ
jgi:SH3-like domain-containing protein